MPTLKSSSLTGLGYTGEGSSSSKPKKEVRFVLAKNVEKPKAKKLKVEKPKVEIPAVVKRTIGPKSKEKGKSLPKKSKGTSSEAFLSSLWRARTHKTKFLQASSF